MIRKWEWIMRYCKRQGYEETADCVVCDKSECSDSGCEFYRLTGHDLIDAFIDARSKEFEGLQEGLARLV